MRTETLRDLLQKGLLKQEQYQKLEPLVGGNIVSVFYELRTILYLGIMLFTTGMGILIYQNIGELGHLLSIIALGVITGVCFWYAFSKGLPYSHQKVNTPIPFFDYIVLLGCLLFISVQGYLQYQYHIFEDSLSFNTLITALFFFYAAYRFDHLGVLSLAITALASFWSISISPQEWYSSDYLTDQKLYNTGLIFSTCLIAVAMFLNWKTIKKHFTFTYVNFSMLIFFASAFTGLFTNTGVFFLYVLIVYAGSAFAVYYAHTSKSFLFLLYAFVSAYIATTYWLADTVLVPELWFLYMIASCGGFIYFIIRFKNYFKREA